MIRFARSNEAEDIVRLIKELAVFEREPDAVKVTPQEIEREMMSQSPAFECLIAKEEGEVVGFALFFNTYSTWLGKRCMHLEDIYVMPAYQGRGIGVSLLRKLFEICREREYGRMEWQVLKWNIDAIKLYKSLGAVPLDEWVKYRLSEDALRNL